MGKLDGKVILMTGAASGLGQESQFINGAVIPIDGASRTSIKCKKDDYPSPSPSGGGIFIFMESRYTGRGIKL